MRIVVMTACFLCSCMLFAEDSQRGGHVLWARLKTHYAFWHRHTDNEFVLLDYIRNNTSLDIDSKWATADLYDLKSLTAYPFVFAEGIQTVTDKAGQLNLREYLLRGGFLLIDSCINHDVNPDPDAFYTGQVQRFHEILPEAKIHSLPSDHKVYRCFYNIKELPHSYMEERFDPRWAKYPLYAVELNNRTVSIISLAGLKCGWTFYPTNPEHRTESMRMMVNIYTYALMH